MNIYGPEFKIIEDVVIDGTLLKKGTELYVENQDRDYVYLVDNDDQIHVFTYEETDKNTIKISSVRYLIVMSDYDNFLMDVEQPLGNPKELSNNEIILQYMNKNYHGHSFNAISLKSLSNFKTVKVS